MFLLLPSSSILVLTAGVFVLDVIEIEGVFIFVDLTGVNDLGGLPLPIHHLSKHQSILLDGSCLLCIGSLADLEDV